MLTSSSDEGSAPTIQRPSLFWRARRAAGSGWLTRAASDPSADLWSAGKLDALLDHHVPQRAPPSALHSEW